MFSCLTLHQVRKPLRGKLGAPTSWPAPSPRIFRETRGKLLRISMLIQEGNMSAQYGIYRCEYDTHIDGDHKFLIAFRVFLFSLPPRWKGTPSRLRNLLLYSAIAAKSGCISLHSCRQSPARCIKENYSGIAREGQIEFIGKLPETQFWRRIPCDTSIGEIAFAR